MRVAGIMSGTSLDGIDVAIVDVHGGRKTRVETVAFRMHAYPANVRAAILSVSDTMTHTSAISRCQLMVMASGSLRRPAAYAMAAST